MGIARRTALRHVALVLALCLTAAVAEENLVVRMTQVVHHHGSSPPFVRYNATEICGSKGSCGILTRAGTAMLASVGKYLRIRYNDPSVVGEPFFPGSTYDPTRVRSRSTSLASTLQSSSALLHGLFPDNATFNPAIYTVNLTRDFWLDTGAMPSYFLPAVVDAEGLENACADVVDTHFTLEELQGLAKETFSGGKCTQPNERVQCALMVYRIGHFFRTEGRLAHSTPLERSLPMLHDVMACYHAYAFHYDQQDELHQKQGSMGQTLAQTLLSNARDYRSSATSYKMFEYSTSDRTLVPLAVTFGDPSYASQVPEPGATLVLELLENEADHSWHFRLLHGHPETTDKRCYELNLVDFPIQCMAVNGSVYAGENNMCPFDDFVRRVDATRAVDARGFCNVSPKHYAMLHCPQVSDVKARVPYLCRRYREVCPASSCPLHYVLSSADGRCYPLRSSGPLGTYEVRMTHVIHRHGARTAEAKFNKTEICGPVVPCGSLTERGQVMAAAVGEYMRERYNDQSIVGETPFFPSERYNASLVYTRSTVYERTMQSASAFLNALFPDGRHFFPVVYTVPLEQDLVLNTYAIPPAVVKYKDKDGEKRALDPVVDEYFTKESLLAAAEEAYLSGYCSDYEKRTDCALKMFDVMAAFRDAGRLDDKPNLRAAASSLSAIRIGSYRYYYSYNKSLEPDRTHGSIGQSMIQNILGNIRAHMKSPSYRMYEYSTHDITVIPLGMTLGDESDDTLLPPFSTTYMIELLQDTGDDSYHIRVLRGNPQEVAHSGKFEFTQTGFPQRCINSGGEEYLAPHNVCPFDDFVRFIQSTAPAEPNGFCKVGKALYDRMHCPFSIEDNAPVPEVCRNYRSVCPHMACSEGYVLGLTDLQCYPVSSAS